MFLYISMGCVPAYCIHKASKVKINKKKLLESEIQKLLYFLQNSSTILYHGFI